MLGQVDPRIAREWHKPVQNAILWEKMQKWKIMLDFRPFAVKGMKFSLARFSKIQVYIYIYIYISDWICQNIPTGTKHSTQRQVPMDPLPTPVLWTLNHPAPTGTQPCGSATAVHQPGRQSCKTAGRENQLPRQRDS